MRPKAARSLASQAPARSQEGGWPRLLPAGPYRSAFAATPVPPQALKILLAGIDKDERRAVEATVREALGARASSGPWSISVVNFGGKWSVTLDGPGDRLRGLSFVTDPSQLAEAIRQGRSTGAGGRRTRHGRGGAPRALGRSTGHARLRVLRPGRGGGLRATAGRAEESRTGRLPALLEGRPRRDRRLGGRRRRLPLREGLARHDAGPAWAARRAGRGVSQSPARAARAGPSTRIVSHSGSFRAPSAS